MVAKGIGTVGIGPNHVNNVGRLMKIYRKEQLESSSELFRSVVDEFDAAFIVDFHIVPGPDVQRESINVGGLGLLDFPAIPLDCLSVGCESDHVMRENIT